MAGSSPHQPRIRPEFERRLAKLTADEQDAILDEINRVLAEPVSREDALVALSEDFLVIRSTGNNLWIQYRILPDASVSFLTCGRYPKNIDTGRM